MKANETHTRALVLGGADLIIGTSAGSVVGAQITSGTDLERLFAVQLTPVEQTRERMVAFDAAQMMEAFRQAVAEVGPDSKAIRARIGAYALAAPTISEAERRDIIESRLPVQSWPKPRLLIVAVNTETGEEYIMDRAFGVSLVDAVAASCAVPGIWPPVTIAGRRYMDGGMRSATNADLARGFERIVILNPLGEAANYLGVGTAQEAATLQQEGSQVLVIEPDAAAAGAIGLNPLDPATREPSALAGRAQGRELAKSVAALWSTA